MFRDEADVQLAYQDWLEVTEDLTEEELERYNKPTPALSDEQWEECWEAVRGDNWDQQQEMIAQHDKYLEKLAAAMAA